MARSIILTVDTEADPEAVTTALTTREGLASFWTSDVDASPEVGSTIRLGFVPAPVDLEMTVAAIEPGRRVEWECQGPWPYWGGTRVEWTILEGDTRQVMLAHRGWSEEQPEPEFGSVAQVWAMVLQALKSYVESGISAPALA